MHTSHHTLPEQQTSTATLFIVLFAVFSICTLAAVLLRTMSTQLESSATTVAAPTTISAQSADQFSL